MTFLDANIIIELALGRKKLPKIEKYITEEAINPSVSLLSIHLLFYFGHKEGIAFDTLCGMVDGYKKQDLTEADYHWAKLHCADDDFEDALQVAIAMRNRCKLFVTLDKNLAKNYNKFINIKLI